MPVVESDGIRTEVVISETEEIARRFKTGGVITVSAAHFVHDTYTAFLAPLLPVLIANLSITKTAAGMLTVFYQMPSLLQPFIGHLADRLNLRILVILAPALSGLMLSLVGVAPAYGLVALLMIVAGLSSAGLHAVGPVMAGLLAGNRLGRGMSFWMVGGELGRTLGPIIIVAAVTLLTPQELPALAIGGVAASTLLFFRLRDINVSSAHGQSTAGFRLGFQQIRPIFLPLVAIIAARSLLAMSLATFLPTFLTEEGAELWFAGVSLSLMEAAGVIGALMGGSISDRLGRRRVLVVMSLAAPLMALLFLNLEGWARIPTLLFLGLTLLSTIPVLMALVQERTPGGRALANGIFQALNFVITSLAVVLVGTVADRFGLRTAYLASALVMLAGLPFVFLLPKDEAK